MKEVVPKQRSVRSCTRLCCCKSEDVRIASFVHGMDVQLLPSDEQCNRITHSGRAFDPSVSSVPSRPRSKRAEGEFVFMRALGATSCVGRQRCYRAVINVCSLGGDLETS